VSPTWFSALGSGLTLPWLASQDRDAIEAHSLGLARRLRTELQLPQEDSAIVSIPTAAADKLGQAGIRASIRAGAVRVGFHLYNTDDDLDRLVDVLR
jgi:selenocysteine lyase/cysteine desulfurase